MTDPRGYTYTEEHRHRCEVRQVLRWRIEKGRPWVHEWLNGREETTRGKTGQPIVVVKTKGVRHQRGQAAVDRIMADCIKQWSLGNDGTGDRWLS